MKLDLYLTYFRATISKQRLKHRSLYRNTCTKNKQLLTEGRRGIYKLNLHDCTGCHIGQTERSFKVRSNEHTRAICSDMKIQVIRSIFVIRCTRVVLCEILPVFLIAWHKGLFICYSIPVCYHFISFVFYILPYICEHLSTKLGTSLECLLPPLDHVRGVVRK